MEFQGLVTCYWIILDQVQGPCIAIPLQQRHPGAGVEHSLISLILTFFGVKHSQAYKTRMLT